MNDPHDAQPPAPDGPPGFDPEALDPSKSVVFRAAALARLGYTVHPVRRREKRPALTGWQDTATSDPREANRLFATVPADSNVGFLTGPRSGLFVLDEDEPGHLGRWAAGRSIGNPVLVETGSGNRQYLYRWTPGCGAVPSKVKGVTAPDGSALALDVRGQGPDASGGSNAVAPGSTHPSGGAYRFLSAPAFPHEGPPARMIGALTAGGGGGSPPDPGPPAAVPAPGPTATSPAPTAAGGPLRFVLEAEAGPSGERGRAARWLEKRPPAVEGSGGDDHTFGTLCAMLEAFPALTDADFGDGSDGGVLTAWNERCVPPWTPKELRHRLKNARRTAGVPDPGAWGGHEDGRTPEAATHAPAGPPVEGPDEWAARVRSAVSDPPPPAPMTADAWHGPLAEAVARLAPATEADRNATLVSALVLWGAKVGPGPHAVLDLSSRHGCNEFAVIVGDTAAARKGTSLSVARHVLDGCDPAPPADVRGLGSGEAMVKAVAEAQDPGPSKDAPDLPGVGSDPADPNAVTPAPSPFAAATATNRPVLVEEEEFGRMLTAAGRDGCTLVPVLQQAWDGKPLTARTRGETLEAADPHVGVLGHVTRAELDRRLGASDTANGFANRFLWTFARRSAFHADAPEPADVSDLRAVLAQNLESVRAAGDVRVGLTDAARGLWRDVYRPVLEDPTPPRTGTWADVTTRAAPHVRRLAVTFATTRGRLEVDAADLRAALEVWRYCSESARWAFGCALVTDTQARILEAVEAGGAVDRTAARKACGNGKTRASAIVRDLDALVRDGFLVAGKRKVGPPTGRGSKTVTVWGAPHEFAPVAVPPPPPADGAAEGPAARPPAAGLGTVLAFVRNDPGTRIVPLEGGGWVVPRTRRPGRPGRRRGEPGRPGNDADGRLIRTGRPAPGATVRTRTSPAVSAKSVPSVRTQPGSYPGRRAFEPTMIVRPAGFEPATSGSVDRRSIQLS